MPRRMKTFRQALAPEAHGPVAHVGAARGLGGVVVDVEDDAVEVDSDDLGDPQASGSRSHVLAPEAAEHLRGVGVQASLLYQKQHAQAKEGISMQRATARTGSFLGWDSHSKDVLCVCFFFCFVFFIFFLVHWDWDASFSRTEAWQRRSTRGCTQPSPQGSVYSKISVQRLEDLMVPRFCWLLLRLHESLKKQHLRVARLHLCLHDGEPQLLRRHGLPRPPLDAHTKCAQAQEP